VSELSDSESDARLMALEERWRSDRSPRVFLQLADELRRSGQTRRAIDVLRDGLEWHPESVSGWVVLGRSLLEEADPAAALEALDQALERDPAQLVASKLSAEAWISLHEPDRADEALARYRLLAAPDAELERLESEIRRLRPAAGPPEEPPAVAAHAPFELPPPANVPRIDLGETGFDRRGWVRVEIDRQPFRSLLAAPGAGASRWVERLGQEELFALSSVAVSAPPQVEPELEPPTASEDEPTFELIGEPLPERALGESPAEVEAVAETEGSAELEAEPALGETETGTEAGATEVLAEVSDAPPPVPVFEPTSIGEEVERETAVAPADPGAPEDGSRRAGSTTLAALYFAQGHLDEAEAEYRAVLALRPADETALTALTRIEAARSGFTVSGGAPDAPAERPLGLTARKVARLRELYERLRDDRRARSRRVP